MYTACWSTFDASLPFVCAVTCLRRCGGYRPHPTPQKRDRGRTIFSAMQVSECFGRQSHAEYQTSCLFRQKTGLVHQSVHLTHLSCRRDTNDAIVVMHDSTMNDAVPFSKKKLHLKSTAGHGRVVCFRTKVSAAIGGTNNVAIPIKQDAKSGGSTCRFHHRHGTQGGGKS